MGSLFYKRANIDFLQEIIVWLSSMKAKEMRSKFYTLMWSVALKFSCNINGEKKREELIKKNEKIMNFEN